MLLTCYVNFAKIKKNATWNSNESCALPSIQCFELLLQYPILPIHRICLHQTCNYFRSQNHPRSYHYNTDEMGLLKTNIRKKIQLTPFYTSSGRSHFHNEIRCLVIAVNPSILNTRLLRPPSFQSTLVHVHQPPM